MRFPTPALDPRGQVIPGSYRKDKFHRDTILDGEIVNDILEDGTEQLKFLVFDALIVDGKNLMHRNLSTRLGVPRKRDVTNVVFHRVDIETLPGAGQTTSYGITGRCVRV